MTGSRFLELSDKPALSVFFTAGYPRRDDTTAMLHALQLSGVHFVEIGFPFSDPVADGPTIQESNQVALANGMTVARLFEQLKGVRSSGITLPLLLMGYLNPVERFGRDRFFAKAAASGIDGLILPDMPFDEYLSKYKPLFLEHRIKPVFLVTSRTEPERIRTFDAEDPAFIYILSSDAVTGGSLALTEERDAFFKRIKELKLKSRLIVGFGVSDAASFTAVTKHTEGAIIGSAFLRSIKNVPEGASPFLSEPKALQDTVSNFIKQVR